MNTQKPSTSITWKQLSMDLSHFTQTCWSCMWVFVLMKFMVLHWTECILIDFFNMQTGIYSHLNCHIKHRKKKYLIINVCLEIHHQEREAQWWMPMQLQMPMIPEATAQPLPGEEYTTFHWQPSIPPKPIYLKEWLSYNTDNNAKLLFKLEDCNIKYTVFCYY